MACFHVVTAALISMVIFRTSAQCPNGFTRYGDSCYHFSHEKESWEAALEICERFQSSLAEIDSIAEGKYLSNQAPIFDHSYWIGGQDLLVEGTWTWIKGGLPVNNTGFTNWKPGQPDNDGGKENCLMIYDTGLWNDNRCDESEYYICEKKIESNAIVG